MRTVALAVLAPGFLLLGSRVPCNQLPPKNGISWLRLLAAFGKVHAVTTAALAEISSHWASANAGSSQDGSPAGR